VEKSIPTNPLKKYSGWSSSSIVITLTEGQGRPIAVVLLLLLTITFAIYGADLWRPMSHFVFDTYQRFFPRQVKQFPVVIVDIDDASLAALGRWPWPRTRLAKLTEVTHQLGAKAIGLDIIMPEPDSFSPNIILSDRPDVSLLVREELAKLASNDSILAQTLQRTPSVVARAGLIESEQAAKTEDRQTPIMVIGESPIRHVTSYGGHLASIPLIEHAAFGCGYLNDTRDQDGVVRSMPLLISVNGQLAPAFSLELLRTAIGVKWYSVHGSSNGVRGIQLGESFIPTDSDGRIRLHFSPAYGDRRVSALALLNGELSAGSFANQVAVIGVSGVGTIDVASTPVSARMDGLEIQAQIVENILANSRLIRSPRATWLELGVFLLVGILLITLLPRSRPGYGIAAFLSAAVLLCSGSIFSFVKAKTLYDPSFPIVGNVPILVALLAAGFSASNRKRQELEASLEIERLERVRISGELQAAREIQMGILPEPGSIEGLPLHLEFYAMLEPAYEVGGDLYDAFMIDDRHFFFCVGDVAGKGVAASLFMALSKTLCKSAALRGYVPLNDLIGKFNREISRENQAMLFVTMIAGIIDVVSGELQLCSAGHDAPILMRHNEPLKYLPIEGGPPLCVLEGYEYCTTRMTLRSNDMLVLISDGITEAQDPDQNSYGRERIINYLNTLKQADWHAESICRGLYRDLKQFIGDASQSDDITIMAVRFDAPNPSSAKG
jgi:serine phosphatase RsbU (regulator of sigma subunit)